MLNSNVISMTVLLQLRDAHKSYGEQILLDGAECTITDTVKTGFIGRNGAGKSTLLKILLGEDDLDRGEVIRHPSLRLGYLRQHDPFEAGESALDFLMRDSGSSEPTMVLRNVVLPWPLSPTIAAREPCSISTPTPAATSCSG